jgi:hypothetical protein
MADAIEEILQYFSAARGVGHLWVELDTEDPPAGVREGGEG